MVTQTTLGDMLDVIYTKVFFSEWEDSMRTIWSTEGKQWQLVTFNGETCWIKHMCTRPKPGRCEPRAYFFTSKSDIDKDHWCKLKPPEEMVAQMNLSWIGHYP